MKATAIRLTKLLFGLILYALSMVLSINANLGMAPWELFHSGIATRTGATFGQVSIFFSFVIVAVDYFVLKERIGVGTLLNMVLIGVFIDLINALGFVPVQAGYLSPFSYIQHFMAMICLSFGLYFYVGAGYGAGPRDGFFIGLSKKTGISTKLAKTIMEAVVFVIGALMGAHFGIGTLMFAFQSGPVIAQVTKMLNFNLSEVNHVYIDDIIRNIKHRKEAVTNQQEPEEEDAAEKESDE